MIGAIAGRLLFSRGARLFGALARIGGRAPRAAPGPSAAQVSNAAARWSDLVGRALAETPPEMKIRINDSQVRQVLGPRADRAVRYAAARALNRGASATRAQTVRRASRRLGVKQPIIQRRIRKGRNATGSRLEATSRVYLRKVNPVDGGAREEHPAGVWGMGWRWRKGFIARSSLNNRRFVFVRREAAATSTGKDSKGRPRRGRLPVTAKKVDIERELIEEATRALSDNAERVINQVLPRELRRRGIL